MALTERGLGIKKLLWGASMGQRRRVPHLPARAAAAASPRGVGMLQDVVGGARAPRPPQLWSCPEPPQPLEVSSGGLLAVQRCRVGLGFSATGYRNSMAICILEVRSGRPPRAGGWLGSIPKLRLQGLESRLQPGSGLWRRGKGREGWGLAGAGRVEPCLEGEDAHSAALIPLRALPCSVPVTASASLLSPPSAHYPGGELRQQGHLSLPAPWPRGVHPHPPPAGLPSSSSPAPLYQVPALSPSRLSLPLVPELLLPPLFCNSANFPPAICQVRGEGGRKVGGKYHDN